jgi:hypothetical protein
VNPARPLPLGQRQPHDANGDESDRDEPAQSGRLTEEDDAGNALMDKAKMNKNVGPSFEKPCDSLSASAQTTSSSPAMSRTTHVTAHLQNERRL